MQSRSFRDSPGAVVNGLFKLVDEAAGVSSSTPSHSQGAWWSRSSFVTTHPGRVNCSCSPLIRLKGNHKTHMAHVRLRHGFALGWRRSKHGGQWTVVAREGHINLKTNRIGIFTIDATAPIVGGEADWAAGRAQLKI